MSSQATDLDFPDPANLGDHFRQCAFARSRLYRFQCVAEALNAFLAPRFVTTLGVMTVVMLVGIGLSTMIAT